MRKAITTFMILLSIGIIILTGVSFNKLKDITYAILFVLTFLCIQLTKNIINIDYKKVTLLQIVLVLISLYFGYIYASLLLSISLFDLFEDKLTVIINIFISIFVLFVVGIEVISMKDITFLAVIIVMINLYLREIKYKIDRDDELKKLNKASNDSKISMNKKIAELEKYLDQNNIMTVLKERNFIAQKLHDHLGHRITSSIMQLEVTNEMIGKNDEVAKKALVTSMSNLREGMEEIREFLRQVKPGQSVIGIEAIKELVLKFQYVSGIETAFLCEGGIASIKLMDIRVIEQNIKEALTNSAKYSGASKITVSVFIYNLFYRVEVRDNGCGIEKLSKGLGLRGIEERLAEINGRVEYYNDNGFVINMIVNKRSKNEY